MKFTPGCKKFCPQRLYVWMDEQMRPSVAIAWINLRRKSQGLRRTGRRLPLKCWLFWNHWPLGLIIVGIPYALLSYRKPADLLQAEDRAWRRERNGQSSKTCVNIYYCIAKAEGCARTDRWQRLGRKLNKHDDDGWFGQPWRSWKFRCEKHGSQVMLERRAFIFWDGTATEPRTRRSYARRIDQQHLTPNQPIINSLAKRKKSLEEDLKKAFFTEPERVPICPVVSEHTDRVHLHDMRLLPNETRLNCSVKQADVCCLGKTGACRKIYAQSWRWRRIWRCHDKTMSPALREKTKYLRNFVLPDAWLMTATHSTVVNFSSTNGTVCYLAIKTLSYNRVHRFVRWCRATSPRFNDKERGREYAH